jgi:hypothetical protein
VPPSQLTANPDSYAAGQGKALTVSVTKGVLVNDRDPQGKPLIAILDSNPAHGSLTFHPDGSFIYTNDGTGASQDSFTYQVSNGTALSNITSVTITLGAPDAITAAPDFYSLPHGGAITVGAPGVLTNDIDPNGLALTAATLAPPLHGSLTLSPNGGFMYAHDGTNTTSDTFAYRATDGTLTSPSTNAFLTIGPDSPPTVGSQSYATMQNTPLTVAAPGVLTGATDPDSPTITAVLQNSAAHGSVTLNPNGSFSYTPATGFSGADSFTFRGSDGIVSSVNPGTASIAVAAIPRPSAIDDRFVATTSALTINAPGILGNDTMNGGTLISFGRNGNDQTGIGHPAVTSNNGQITLNADGSFTYNAPSPTFAGDDTFRYIIGNSSGTSTATVIVTVAPLNTNCPGMTIGPAALPSGSAGVAYPAVSFSQTGGAVPIAWATGTLPPGMTFSNAGALSGTPTATGSFNVTVSATDANACMVIKTLTLDVGCPPIAIGATNLAAGTVGVAYPATTLTLTGGVAPITWSILSGALPAGMNLSGNGILSGTPAQTSAFAFTVKAADANGCSGTPRTLILIVNSKCPSIAITPGSLTGGAVGVVYPAVSFSQSGGAAPVTWSSGALPPGMSFSTAGVLSGTPTSIGTFNIAVTVVDANGCMFSVVMPLTISGTCPTITATAPTLPTATQGAVYPNAAFQASGGVAPYSWSIILGSLPTGMTLSSSGLLSGTPVQSGSFAFNVQARDANNCASASQAVTLTVSKACGTITIAPSTLTAPTSVAYAAALTQSGDVAPVTFTPTAGTAPPGLTLSTTGILSGTPTAAGTYNMGVTVTDANSCSGSGVVTVAITSCPTITVTAPTLPTATQGAVYPNVAFQAGGGVAPYSWSVILGALPTGMTLSSSGLLSGTPAQSGSFPFSVQAIDANNCASASKSVTLTVSKACSTITIAPASLTAPISVAYAAAITQSGGVAPVTFLPTAGTVPAGLMLSTTGIVSGTPTTGGTFNMGVTVTDANSCPGSGVVTVVITSCPAITVTAPTLPTATQGAVYPNVAFQASNGVAPYSWSIILGALPTGMTLSSSGLLSGTPAQSGSFTFSVQARDANNCASASQIVTLTVAKACATITIAPSSLTAPISVAYAAALTQSGGIAPVTFLATTGTVPAGLTLSTTGILSGTPTAAGTFNMGVTVTDANGCIGSGVVTVVITSCPSITVSTLTLPSATPGVIYPNATFQATGGAAPYTWSIVNGVLPSGMTLSTGGVLSGTPAQSGSFAFDVRPADANNCPGTAKSFTLTVNTCGTITITPSTLPDATRGLTYAAVFSQTGGALPVTWSAGTLPPGLAMTAAGVLSGTPTATGTFDVGVTVTDANGCIGNAVATLKVNITPCPTITVTAITLPGGSQNVVYPSVTFQATGGQAPLTWAVVLGSVPSGMSLSSGGVLTGTPAQAGSFTFSVMAVDANNCASNAKSVTLNVAVPCPSITIVGAPPNGQTGVDYAAYQFLQSGGAAPVTWSIVNPPPIVSTSPAITFDPVTGILSGLPTKVGTFSFTLGLTDSNNCTAPPTTFSITITCGPIIAKANAQLVTHGNSFHSFEDLTVQSLGFTQSYGIGSVTYAVSDGVLPSGISLSSDGSITGLVIGRFSSLNFPVRIRVTDSLGCSGDDFVYVFGVCDIGGSCP